MSLVVGLVFSPWLCSCVYGPHLHQSFELISFFFPVRIFFSLLFPSLPLWQTIRSPFPLFSCSWSSLLWVFFTRIFPLQFPRAFSPLLYFDTFDDSFHLFQDVSIVSVIYFFSSVHYCGNLLLPVIFVIWPRVTFSPLRHCVLLRFIIFCTHFSQSFASNKSWPISLWNLLTWLLQVYCSWGFPSSRLFCNAFLYLGDSEELRSLKVSLSNFLYLPRPAS